MNDNLPGLALERSSSSKVRNLALEHGLVLLRHDGWSKVRQGITTIKEVVRATKG